jgi:hypothetical protein
VVTTVGIPKRVRVLGAQVLVMYVVSLMGLPLNLTVSMDEERAGRTNSLIATILSESTPDIRT